MLPSLPDVSIARRIMEQSLVVSRWAFVVGRRSLVVGRRSLVVGRRSLVVGPRHFGFINSRALANDQRLSTNDRVLPTTGSTTPPVPAARHPRLRDARRRSDARLRR